MFRSLPFLLIIGLVLPVSGCCDRTIDVEQPKPSYDTGSRELKKFEIPAQKRSGSVDPPPRRKQKNSSSPEHNQNVEKDLARAKEYCRRGMEMSAVRHLDRVLKKAGENDYLLKTKAHYLLAEIYQSENLEGQANHHWEQFMENHRRLRAAPRMQAKRETLKSTADWLGRAVTMEENGQNESETDEKH